MQMARDYQSIFSKIKEKTLHKRNIRSRVKNKATVAAEKDLATALAPSELSENKKPSSTHQRGIVIAKVSQEVQDIVNRNLEIRDGKKKSETLQRVDSIIVNEIGPHFTRVKKSINKLQLEVLEPETYATEKRNIIKQLVYIQSGMGSMIYKYFFAK